ncbi:fimbrillin family protein [Parabacteroides timonensis]|uniref:fimbrillin family protein n=1 Tax=Parabacteroides timonensis TaxID=1871013 RepID=UPI00094E355A|nr:fimbrillin family protein [Parabacteroides timonensis]
MKLFIYIFSTAVFLLLAYACTEATIFTGDGGDDGKGGSEEGEVPLRVKNLGLSVEVESRSIVTGGPGDGTADTNPNPLTEVELYVTKKDESGTVSVYDDGNTTTWFVYNGMASPAAAWEPMVGQEVLLLSSVKGTVYAYSPAGESVSLSGTFKVPIMGNVKVLDQQTFKFAAPPGAAKAAGSVEWDTDQADYLYCKVATEVDRWHPAVSLLMNHALAKVSFRVVEKEGGTAFAGCKVKKVVLKSSGGLKKSATATLNLSTGELGDTMIAASELSFTAAGTDDMRVIGTGVSEAADIAGVPIQAFGLVIPVMGADVTLELTLEDDRVFTMSPSEGTDVPGTFSVNWEKGNNYIYNIGMSPQGIEIADVVVAGWNEGGVTEVPME